MKRCVIGIDGGGTKTVCIVAAEDGSELGRAQGGPSNYQTIGVAGARGALGQVIEEATRQVGSEFAIHGLCLALAGVDREPDRQAVRSIVAQLLADGAGRLPWRVSPADAIITNDAVAALVGGAGRRLGVVVVAGTGSIAFGLNAQGQQRRAGGWGYLLGDEGSGYAIGLAGLRAACRAADGRGAPTALGERLLAAFGLSEPTDLIGLVYGRWGVPQIAAVAPLVFDSAAQGDRVAKEIVEAAADELALAAAAVIRGPALSDQRFDVVTAGGVWSGAPALRERFAAAVRAVVPLARVVPPRREPVWGAVLLALESIGAARLDEAGGDRPAEADRA